MKRLYLLFLCSIALSHALNAPASPEDLRKEKNEILKILAKEWTLHEGEHETSFTILDADSKAMVTDLRFRGASFTNSERDTLKNKIRTVREEEFCPHLEFFDKEVESENKRAFFMLADIAFRGNFSPHDDALPLLTKKFKEWTDDIDLQLPLAHDPRAEMENYGIKMLLKGDTISDASENEKNECSAQKLLIIQNWYLASALYMKCAVINPTHPQFNRYKHMAPEALDALIKQSVADDLGHKCSIITKARENFISAAINDVTKMSSTMPLAVKILENYNAIDLHLKAIH